MKLLVSVRTVAEAAVAAADGADFIDLKEPRAGALGGLPVALIGDIVSVLRASGCTLPVSATIGAPAQLPCCCSARSRRLTAKPSMSVSCRSSSTRAGGRARQAATASAPVAASRTRRPRA